jgi:mannose-1-phosphate guanylyltransferase/phosphomannomutase
MKAVLLCAGFGTRLGELTKECPKPLLEVGEISIVERQILSLKEVGVCDFYINLHYLAENIKNSLGDGSKYGIRITYKYEASPTGTAGGVRIFESELKGCDAFFVLYGDIVTNEDFSRIVNFFEETKAEATIYVHERKDSNSIISLTAEGVVSSFIERPTEEVKTKYRKENNTESFLVNSGIYLFKESIFEYFGKEKEIDFPKDVFPILVEQKKLNALKIEGTRFAIDSKERLRDANKYFKKEVI